MFGKFGCLFGMCLGKFALCLVCIWYVLSCVWYAFECFGVCLGCFVVCLKCTWYVLGCVGIYLRRFVLELFWWVCEMFWNVFAIQCNRRNLGLPRGSCVPAVLSHRCFPFLFAHAHPPGVLRNVEGPTSGHVCRLGTASELVVSLPTARRIKN